MHKIAFLLNSLRGGGSERVTLSLANGLATAGCDVSLLLVEKTGELLCKVGDNVRLHCFGKERAVACMLPLRRYLLGERPDVLFTALPTVNIVGIAGKLLAGAPTAVIPVEHMPVGIDSRQNPSWEPRIAYFLYPFFYRWAERIISIGEDARADFLKTFPSIRPEKVKLLNTAVISDELLAAAEEVPSMPWLADRDLRRPVLIAAGRLVKDKGFHVLLHSFVKVREASPCRLVILGTGPEQSRLQELARELGIGDDVLLPGFVNNPASCFSRASVFVLSSRYETLPTVLIEALACGLPVVATPCTGVREILAGGKFGTILGSSEPEEMAAGIVAALGQVADRDALRARGREYSVQRAVANYLSLIEEVKADRSKAGARR